MRGKQAVIKRVSGVNARNQWNSRTKSDTKTRPYRLWSPEPQDKEQQESQEKGERWIHRAWWTSPIHRRIAAERDGYLRAPELPGGVTRV